MKEKIKAIQARMEQDPKLKKAVTQLKPQKSFWGIAGVVIFFFLPELVTFLWQEELVSWSHLHSLTEPASSLRWLFTQLEEMFASGVSYVNLVLGSLLLWWAVR